MSLMRHFVLLHQVGTVRFGGGPEGELWEPHSSPPYEIVLILLCEIVSFFLMNALD